jgi:hypothetical protein
MVTIPAQIAASLYKISRLLTPRLQNPHLGPQKPSPSLTSAMTLPFQFVTSQITPFNNLPYLPPHLRRSRALIIRLHTLPQRHHPRQYPLHIQSSPRTDLTLFRHYPSRKSCSCVFRSTVPKWSSRCKYCRLEYLSPYSLCRSVAPGWES